MIGFHRTRKNIKKYESGHILINTKFVNQQLINKTDPDSRTVTVTIKGTAYFKK